MSAQNARKRKSEAMDNDPTTPTGSPAKKMRITQAQKQALIDNLQLESEYQAVRRSTLSDFHCSIGPSASIASSIRVAMLGSQVEDREKDKSRPNHSAEDEDG